MTEYSHSSIGSFYIHCHDTIYSLSTYDTKTDDNNITHNNHPMYNILFQYFQSNEVEMSRFISSKESIYSLSNMVLHKHSNPFSIQTANKLLQCMYSQIHFLLEHDIAISFIDINDIMVVNGNKFYFCNYHKLYHIKNNKSITITDFYDLQNTFLPPEMIDNNKIPFSTYYTTSFYSLAILILYCLKKSNKLFHEDTTNRIDCDCETDSDSSDSSCMSYSYQFILNHYRHTKLYTTLTYCLIKDPCQRTFHLF